MARNRLSRHLPVGQQGLKQSPLAPGALLDSTSSAATAADLLASACGNESVGSGGHPSGMSETKTGGTDTRPARGSWFLFKFSEFLRPSRAALGALVRRDERGFVGDDDGLHAVPEVQLRQDAAHVGLDGIFLNEKLPGDLAV